MGKARGAAAVPPLVVICGDNDYEKQLRLQQTIDGLLSPEADRGMALSEYDGRQAGQDNGPDFATVADDLATLPFLAERRIVVIRSADRFISAYRERLERLAAAPPPAGTLILECRSFPANTRLHKAVAAVGQVLKCEKLRPAAVQAFVEEQVRARGKRIEPAAAGRVASLVGQDAGMLAMEAEKLCLYVGERTTITVGDVTELVGLSREEKVFAAVDAAGAGRVSEALTIWHDVLATDRAAAFKAVGGIAYKLRVYLAAQRLAGEGQPARAIAPKVQMWGRERELEVILRRLSLERLMALLAALAELDSQAKVGARSIETGVESFLVQVACAAA